MSKEKILEAAFQLFSTGCYGCIALSEIAEKSEIKKPSIYAHFKSKEELFLEVLDKELDTVIKYVGEIITQNENCHSSEMLRIFLEKNIEYVIDNRPVGKFWSNLLFSTQKDLMEEINIRTSSLKNFVQQEIFSVIKRGVERKEIEGEDLHSLVFTYLSFLQGILIMTLNSKSYTIEDVNVAWNYFWEGIRKKN